MSGGKGLEVLAETEAAGPGSGALRVVGGAGVGRGLAVGGSVVVGGYSSGGGGAGGKDNAEGVDTARTLSIKVWPGRECSPRRAMPRKLSVGSGIEVVVPKSVRPIRTVQSVNPADQISGNLIGSRTLSK